MKIRRLNAIDKETMDDLFDLENRLRGAYLLSKAFMFRGFYINIMDDEDGRNYLYIDHIKQPIRYIWSDKSSIIKYVIDYVYKRENP